MTVDTIITDAFRSIGLPKQAKDLTYQDMAYALRALNSIIDTYNAQSILGSAEASAFFNLVAGSNGYQLGPNVTPPQFVGQRPVTLDKAVLFADPGINVQRRDLAILDSINGREWLVDNYHGETGIPRVVIFGTGYPNATLNFFPNPDQPYKVDLTYRAQFPTFTSLNDTFDFPPAYRRLLQNSLSIDISAAYNVQPSPTIIEAQRDSLYAVKKLNLRQSPDAKPDPRAPGRRPYFDIRTGWYR